MFVASALGGRFAKRTRALPLFAVRALRVGVEVTWALDPKLSRETSIRKTKKRTARLFIVVVATPFVISFIFRSQLALEERLADITRNVDNRLYSGGGLCSLVYASFQAFSQTLNLGFDQNLVVVARDGMNFQSVDQRFPRGMGIVRTAA